MFMEGLKELVEYGVIGLLLGLSVWGIGVAVERVTSIMIGLSLALKATEAGLLVAIPCVVMNNVLRRRVSELLAQYKAQHGS
jgi:biopolymer transport protein ExbB